MKSSSLRGLRLGYEGRPWALALRQARGLGEQVDLVLAPIGIEVAGHDHRLAGLAHQIIEIAQLILAMAELQGQVHQEDRDIVELQFDDEPLDAGVEIMKALAADARRRQKRIGLLADDGHNLVDRRDPVLAFIGRVMAQRARDEIGLIDHSGAYRTGIHFDEARPRPDPAA